jgi:hypothetical protein
VYAAPVGVFPVDPADVPPEAVRAVRRTLLRHEPDGEDEDLARLIVAVVIAALKVDADDETGWRHAPGG